MLLASLIDWRTFATGSDGRYTTGPVILLLLTAFVERFETVDKYKSSECCFIGAFFFTMILRLYFSILCFTSRELEASGLTS